MSISPETLALIAAFKNPLLDLLSDIKDEVKFFLDKSVMNYIETIRNKFVKTKTFLYRLENVDFYSVYFPITLNYKKKKNFKIDKVEDLFKNSNYISIIGNAGSGKSMLLKHVFLKSIKQIIKIPIVIELRNLNDFEGSFIEYLYILLAGKKLTPNKKILERILTNGEFLFLLDGYDEIYSENKNKLTSELIEFIDNYSNNYFLITSRPGANVESLPRFDCYRVNNLSKKQVNEFINLQLAQIDDKKLAKKIIKVVESPENKDYNSYLSSPLLLSMFIMTFNSYPELPKSKSKFYWNVYDTLCTKHDSFTKHGGFQHERKTGLQNEDFEDILKWFSYTSLFKGKYSFDNHFFTELLRKIKSKLNLNCNINNLKEDLTVAISIIVIDGLEYKFPHRSLQEYFTALLIKEQSEDIKKEIYSSKFSKFSRHTFDRSDNFWNLCLELDSVDFNKYFILKNFEEFLKEIDFSNNELTCRSFLRYFGFKQGFLYDKNEDMYHFNSFEWSGNIIVSILEFIGLMRIRDVSLYEKVDKSITPQVNKMIKDNYVIIRENKEEIEMLGKYVIDYCNNWNDDIYSFIRNTGTEETILNYLKLIKQKMFDLNNELKVQQKNKIDLLEL